MKYGIDCGHCVSGVDYGAVGIRPESILTREVGNRVMAKLKDLGHQVVDCTCNHASSLNASLAYRVNKANSNHVDVFVSIHFNKFTGAAYGTEVFTYKGRRTARAQSVLNNICSLGFHNRGIKGDSLYVTNHTAMEAMLVECCFCDNNGDMQRYSPDKMANAIVRGLTGKTSSATAPSSKPTQPTSKPGGKPLVRKLQAEINRQGFGRLVVDGLAGSATLNAAPTCRQGARGGITKIIQQMLVTIGYPVGSYGADGVFGNGTVTAVKALQRDCNLSADGIVGHDTWSALCRNI